MIATILPFILFLSVYPPPVNLLRCYHCSNPSRQIAHHLWIHKTQTCTRRKPMLCPPESVACVIVRVSHPLLSFTASGCSEDKFIGCDVHHLKHINTTMKRCQCSKSFCNKDLHMKGFTLTTPSESTSKSQSSTPWSNFTSGPPNNQTHYHIRLLDQFSGAAVGGGGGADDVGHDHEAHKQQLRLEMLQKQREQKRLKQQQLSQNNYAGINFIINTKFTLISIFIINYIFYCLF